MARKPVYLVGCGSDDHRIVKVLGSRGNSRPLVLAGTIVSKGYSPIAHSDGDVVYHAISNALFLAIGEHDIGHHFPDTDPDYKGIRGDKLLGYAVKLVRKNGYRVNNVTAMITVGKPKIAPYIDEMKGNAAKLLGVEISCVGIGVTTGEGLSAHGRGEGINVIAQVSLEKARGR